MLELALAAVLLNPANLYSAPDTPVRVTVNAKERVKYSVAPVKLLLLSPEGTIQQEAKLANDAGEIDLAKLLSKVWDGELHYVQAATADNKGVGPPLVVQPVWPPDPAVKARVKGQLKNKPMALRFYVERHVVFDTTLGKIVMAMTPEVAPNTAWNFMHLAGNGFYDGVVFHRVARDFVIQGGDPTGTGFGGPGYLIDLEPSKKKHLKGTLSMARSGDPNSAGSQFFICLNELPALDPGPRSPGYTTFGDVVSGMDVVAKMGALPIEGNRRDGRPVDPPKIIDASLVPAPPRVVKKSD